MPRAPLIQDKNLGLLQELRRRISSRQISTKDLQITSPENAGTRTQIGETTGFINNNRLLQERQSGDSTGRNFNIH